MELRKRGASYRRIAAELGVSHTQARDDVFEALADLAAHTRDKAAEYRALELERLELPMEALAPDVERGDKDAIDRWVKLSESRRRLLGLDAPTKVAPTNPAGDGPAKVEVEHRTATRDEAAERLAVLADAGIILPACPAGDDADVDALHPT